MSKRYPGGIIRKTPQTPSQTSAQGIWDMASVTQAVKENTWPIAGVPDPISKSLRFRSSASAYLNRTPASVGNRRTWTFSTWIKLGEIAASNGTIFAAGTTSGVSTRFYLRYTGSQFQTGYGSFNLDTTVAVYRDPSAWYHVVLAIDTTQATAANRLKIYVNGVQQTVTTSVNYSQNDDTAVNNSVTHSIARDHIIPGGYFDGYLTETYLIDGQALTPSSFGNTNDQTGVWQPIAYTGTYGTNGFYLPFSNTASTTTLGYDFSGNSNNWTTNNISLTSGTTYDSMVDVPTQWIPYNTAGDTGALFRGNYCVMNPLVQSSGLSDGNLKIASSSFEGTATQAILSASYFEFTVASAGGPGNGPAVGISGSLSNSDSSYDVRYTRSGQKRVNGTSSAYGGSWAVGDVIGIAYDPVGNTITFYKNNVSQGAISVTSGITYYPIVFDNSGNAGSINFGQRPFSYTPPAGFKTLCTTNLSTPTIGATASTQANKYFDATLYTGTSANQTITNAGGFQPDLVWTKGRNYADFHALTNAVCGASRWLPSNGTNAEFDYTANDSGVKSFVSNGFTLQADGSGIFNQSGKTYVAWQWKANGSGSSNTAGSITSTVSANTTAGFSIVTYTGTGANATVGHGLGVAPRMIIWKNRNATASWVVWHTNFSAIEYIYLNLTNAVSSSGGSTVMNSTLPTSSVFSLGTYADVNGSGNGIVAYCFAQVAGYSAFGSYTGNGSTDGPFVFTGFRPRYVLIKKSSSATDSDWRCFDTARNTYNVVDLALYPNLSNAEGTFSVLDFTSNGFKLRNTGAGTNANSETYIYMAFAESPFKYALAR